MVVVLWCVCVFFFFKQKTAYEIGGGDEQAPAARVLGGDLREQLGRHLLLDLALERPVVEQAVARGAVFEDVRRPDGGEIRVHVLVIAGAEKRERRDQRADARSRHHREFGPRAGLGPAGEHAGAIGAVGAATRDREPGAGRLRQQVRESLRIAPHPRVGDAGDDRGVVFLGGERRALSLALLLRGVLGRRAFPLDLLPGLRQGLRRCAVERYWPNRERAKHQPSGKSGTYAQRVQGCSPTWTRGIPTGF